jgi:hypothetical protein
VAVSTMTRALTNKMIDEEEKGPHVAMVMDNPAKGFILYGPFANWRDARDWLDAAADGNGHVVQLEEPS